MERVGYVAVNNQLNTWSVSNVDIKVFHSSVPLTINLWRRPMKPNPWLTKCGAWALAAQMPSQGYPWMAQMWVVANKATKRELTFVE